METEYNKPLDTHNVFFPIITPKYYGFYLANRHCNWRKHTKKFKTNNRSNKHF